ncbi:nectin-4-like isoform X2 [Scyliorhinus canicula]|uniref:nectin-4-like isoform X2 n=1 Tax=Scyliorhinus canicula TaxID=7830 RepID=UPI0018F6664B|nr:nectin-4-like isoform X2 [Scyliorhinus canicula]
MKSLVPGDGLQMKLFTLVLLVAVRDGKPLDVETQKNMTVLLGGNVTFSCTSHLEDILQVTWQKLNGQSEINIATFSGKFGRNVLESFIGRVAFTQSKRQVSTIVLSGVKFEDEGCYQCVFNSFKSGQKTVKTCLTVNVKDINVETEGNMTAVLGGKATFNCTSHVNDILQVTWQKLNGQSEDNIATVSENFQANFSGAFIGRAAFQPSTMQESVMVLSGVRLEDEGCYQCVFNTFRSGQNIGKTCLTVYAQKKSQLHIWIISVLVTILIVISILSFYYFKKRTHKQRDCQT